MPTKVEVSHRTIVFSVLFLLSLWLLFLVREIILQFFIAMLIASILNPTVAKLSMYKIPRAVSVLLTYIVVLLIIGLAVGGIVPPLVEQTANFVTNLPKYTQAVISTGYFNEQVISQTIARLGDLPSGIAKFTISLFSNVFGVLTVFVFAFYLLLARNRLDSQLAIFFGEKKGKEIGKTVAHLEKRMGGWARGQLALSFLVGITTYIGLILLRIPFSLPLAILAGVLEIIPYIGPIIAAVPAVIIGFSLSTVMGLAVSALFFLVQQLENVLFVPKVMQKSVGMSPLVVLLSLAFGFKLAGVGGLIVSVPVVIVFQVLIRDHLLKK